MIIDIRQMQNGAANATTIRRIPERRCGGFVPQFRRTMDHGLWSHPRAFPAIIKKNPAQRPGFKAS
jgi:hypothetical protein